jgi:hypothetical protein
LFVITDGRDPSDLVDCPEGGLWVPHKVFRETGEKRIGVSEAEAKEDIRRQGFHLIDLERRHGSRPAPAKKTGLAEGRGRYKKTAAISRSPRRRASR